MQRSRSSIFRSEALEHYIQSRENNTLPRISRPPVFLCMWVLLSLCVAAIAAACLSQVPVYVNGAGVVLEQDAIVLVFLPASPAHPLQIHAGAPVHLHIGSLGQTVNSKIDTVETGVLSPAEVQKRYGLVGKMPLPITGPTIVASIKLNAAFPSRSYAGSVVNVHVQVATTNVFSLLLGSTRLNGE